MKNFVGILDKGFELTFTKNKVVFEKNEYEKKNSRSYLCMCIVYANYI